MKQQLKTYIIEFVHWRTNEPKQIAYDCYNQFEALAGFKKDFGKINAKSCNFSNFNMKTI